VNETLGRRLRYERESKGLTLTELSSAIRVREVLLKFIENDNFEKAGPEVYVRGHIRAMATSLDLNSDELMAMYTSQIGGNPLAEPAHMPALEEVSEIESNLKKVSEEKTFSGTLFQPLEKTRAKTSANWSMLMATTLGIITIIAIGTVVSSTFKSGTVEVVQETASPTPTPIPVPTKTNNPDNLTAAVPAPGVEVLIQADGATSWVRAVDVNDVVLFEGMLRDGQDQIVGSTEGVKLLLGNAGAINLTVNGQVLGKAGGQGEVVRVEFGPESAVQ